MQQAQLETKLNKTGGQGGGAQPRSSLSLKQLGLRLAGLAVIDAVAIWFAITLNNNGLPIPAIVLLIITAFVNWIFLDDRFFPFRWITPGFLLLILMVIYPIIYTLYVSFTIYGDGNRLTREQVVQQFQQQTFAPPNAATYTWTAYRNGEGKYLVVLQNKAQNKNFIGDESGLKPYEAPVDLPSQINGYQKLTPFQAAAAEEQLRKLNLKSDNLGIQIVSADSAKELSSKYKYDAATGKLTELEKNVVYTPVKGVFTAPDNTTLSPGFTDFVGFDNYGKVFSDTNITGPFFSVFLWTIIFAFVSVLFSFSVGLGLALILNDEHLPMRTLFRSLLIIPYTIPAFISALVWAGLFSIQGPVGVFSKSIMGQNFSWFSDPNWARVGIILINTWLGFPYMMLICLGALQSIPTDMYEAATIDGASPWQRFWALTLPLLLVSTAPLLIGSFAFNFNNFTLIELLTKGGPDDPLTTTPAGKTDILISYTFRLAFASGKGSDLGLASTISLFIFLLVAGITAFNFRFTKRLEGVLS